MAYYAIVAYRLIAISLFGIATYRFAYRRGLGTGISRGFRDGEKYKVSHALVEVKDGDHTLFRSHIGLIVLMMSGFAHYGSPEYPLRRRFSLALRREGISVFVNGTKQSPPDPDEVESDL